MKTQTKSVQLLTAVTLFTYLPDLSGSELPSWKSLLANRYAALKVCGKPEALKFKELDRVPFETAEVVWKETPLGISDGCSVTVYSRKDAKEYYLEVAGGVADHHRATYGPLRYGEDF